MSTQQTNHVQTSIMQEEEYQELLQQCVHCGLCLEACPTYAIFGTEMDSPRGRIALMRAAASGQLSEETFLNSFAEHIDLCLACRACESACPSGVQYGKLIEGARVALEQARSPGLAERALKWAGLKQLMPNISRFRFTARLFKLYQSLGLEWLIRTVNILPDSLEAMETILPPLSLRYPDYSRPAAAEGELRGRVAFFYGCVQEAFLASINAASVRVLQRNGYEVHFPQNQTCCGAAHWHTGDIEAAKALARQNIDAFLSDEYEAVVNNAGGCGLTLQEYPELLKDDPHYAEKARAFAEKVVDFSQFLLNHLHVMPEGALPVKAVYSDSCHLRHGQKVIVQPRTLLKQIPELTLVEMSHPEHCCGSAGVYNIAQYEVANAVLDAKMRDIEATGAKVIVTSNTGCHMQLLAGVRRFQLQMHVLHIAEILDLSYRADDRRLQRSIRHAKPFFGVERVKIPWLAWQERRRKQDEINETFDELCSNLDEGQLIDDPLDMLTYTQDASLAAAVPDGVVYPYNTFDVQKIAAWADKHKYPLIARGAGTGLAGGTVPTNGGLMVEFSHMKEVVELDEEGRSAVVQPGVITLNFGEVTRKAGLYYPPDPASERSTTLGGNINTNSGGPHCFKYGVTTNYVSGMEVILADGRSMRLGGQALDYPEYDLTGLFNGSEGSLGLLCEAYLTLRKKPPAVMTMMVAFDTVEQAGRGVSAVISRGLVPATMEMMDQMLMQIVEDYVHPGLPVEAGAALIIETDGYAESVGPQIEEIAEVLKENGALEVRIAQTEEERARIWYGRKSAIGALARLAQGYYLIDGTVPRSKLAETLAGVGKICEDLSLQVCYLLHAGDGNLHPLILIPDLHDEDLIARVHEAGRQVSALCVALGGSISGEHGVGHEKRDFMPQMFNADEIAAMQEIKDIFDPHQLLNPGKIFPNQLLETVDHPRPDKTPLSPFSPRNSEEAAQAVRAWVDAGRSIRVVGGGTKSGHLSNADEQLSTDLLRGVLDYQPDDLYVTVGTGTRLADLQFGLERDRMWVPLASPWEDATIGGILSTNFNAPLRMRYGGLRDLVQAVSTILPDGRVLKLGRPLMKNVAGYDLVKLFIGAYGSLGLVSDVTFKLSALPRQRKTLIVPVEKMSRALNLGSMMLKEALVASSVLLMCGEALPQVNTPLALIYTAEGMAEDVAAEIAVVTGRLQEAGAAAPIEVEESGSELWARWMSSSTARQVILRIGLPPGKLRSVVGSLAFDCSVSGGASFAADFAAGMLYLYGEHIDIEVMRQVALANDGYVVVLQPGVALRGSTTFWYHKAEAQGMMSAIKNKWDPQGLFNPGSFII